MDTEGASVERALRGECIADTSLLSNVVNSGYAHLLNRLRGGPVFLYPSVLDDQQVIHPLDSLDTEPTSEFLRSLYMAQFPGNEAYEPWSPHIRTFALGRGTAWLPAAPTTSELALASSFRERKIRAKVRQACPDIRSRIELDAGKAEAAAVAVSRGYTFLVDDRAAVQLVRCLYPDVPVLSTCSLLAHAVKSGYLPPCEEAADLFNRRLAQEMGFYASRRQDGVRQQLRLHCGPPRCVWEQATLPPALFPYTFRDLELPRPPLLCKRSRRARVHSISGDDTPCRLVDYSAGEEVRIADNLLHEG